MSPSSSALPISDSARNNRCARSSSNATPIPPQEASLKPSRTSSRPQSPALPIASSSKPHPHYTVFIRLPFRRGDYEDPPPAEWDASNDRQLWKLISGSHSGKGDLDWEGLSERFGVDLGFLLTQAAWLSERHMERMRRQVGRIAQTGEATGSGLTAGGAVGGLKMERGGSRDSKMPPGSINTAINRESPIPASGDGSTSPGNSTPQTRAAISRTPSSATVTQSKIMGSTSKQYQPLQRAFRTSSGSGRRPRPITTSAGSPRDELYEDTIEHEGHSGSDSEDEPPSALARSQAFRRPPVKQKAKQTLGTLGSDGDADGDDDDDEDSGGGYLPFAATSKPGKNDPAATIRGSPKRQTASNQFPTTSGTNKHKPTREYSAATATTKSSASSASSAMALQRQPSDDTTSGNDNEHDNASQRPPGPISSHHRAQLASISPRFRREGSEGSPSMGSSFSDLDDTSVTQSALEDALMSNMRQGGGSYGSSMASRMSSLKDALGRRNG